MSSIDLSASAATVGLKITHEQPEADSNGNGAQPEVAKELNLRVNNPPGDGKASAENSKALPHTEPPKPLVSHANSDQRKDGEESNVATQFYSLSPYYIVTHQLRVRPA